MSKYGNNYFKWTLFFSLNRLNSIVGACHVFNCINYLLHSSMHTVQSVWGKLIIAACFKSVLHPGLTTLSHFLTEMKALGSCSGAVVTCRAKVHTVSEAYPPYLQWDPVFAGSMYFLHASSWQSLILAGFRMEELFTAGAVFSVDFRLSH